jgi:hypothetical protein
MVEARSAATFTHKIEPADRAVKLTVVDDR